MIEDMQAGRSILACWLVAAWVAPCVAQQGGAADEPKTSVERKLADAPTQQQQQQQQQQQTDVDADEAERRFADGDFRGAALAFGKRLESRRDDAALLYNLALSSWRAGELDAAEDAIDRYAAAPAGGRPDLHHGLLGNIRYRQADQPCTLEVFPGSAGRVLFEEQQRAVTPGQYVVFYQGEYCLGGGVIERAIP